MEAEVVVIFRDKDLTLQHCPASLGKQRVHIEEHGCGEQVPSDVKSVYHKAPETSKYITGLVAFEK